MVNNNRHMTIIWQDKLDKRYDVMVERVSPYKGSLIIKDGNIELLREDTSISHDAPFGADVSDVHAWQDRCADFIDQRTKV